MNYRQKIISLATLAKTNEYVFKPYVFDPIRVTLADITYNTPYKNNFQCDLSKNVSVSYYENNNKDLVHNQTIINNSYGVQSFVGKAVKSVLFGNGGFLFNCGEKELMIYPPGDYQSILDTPRWKNVMAFMKGRKRREQTLQINVVRDSSH
eukprot:Pgem_evm1s18327